MKVLLVAGLYISMIQVVNGQDYNEFASVDRRALGIPASQTQSSAGIAAYVQANFKTDLEKLRAIYAWVITNIRYDTDSMYPINWSLENEERIAATLRRRRGVCENYAALFTDLAVKCGIPSFVVTGHSKMQGSANRSGHSWSAVYLQEQWFLCDPTWDNGYRGSTRYFLVSPAEFIDSHFPFDPLWQLMEHPLTEHEFNNGFSRSSNKGTAFNFHDSAKVFLQLDSLQQLEAATRRIKQAGVENERQKSWVAFNQMKIAGIYGEKDMNLYNSAVADLNKANVIFNDFIQYRNNAFIPLKSDAEMKTFLSPIAGLILAALEKLDKMGKVVENFQYDTGSIKSRLAALSGRVEEQQRFVDRYLATAVPGRAKLFYR